MKRILLLSTVMIAAFAAAAGSVELRAVMSGGKGKAVWKTRDQGTQLQAELSVEAERLAPLKPYKVVIGNNVWGVTTNAFGEFHMEKRYIGRARPTIARGQAVQIKNAAGVVVLTGTFQ